MNAFEVLDGKSLIITREIEKIFDQIDLNKNGLIDYSEFITAATNVRKSLGENHLKAAFNALD